MKWLTDIIKTILNSQLSSVAKVILILSLLLSGGVGYVYIDYRKRDKEKLEIASKQNDKFDLVINKLVDKEKKDSMRFSTIDRNIIVLNNKIDTVRDRQIIDGMIIKEITKTQNKEVIQRINDMENIFQQIKRNDNSYYLMPKQTPVMIQEEQVCNIPMPEPEVKKNDRQFGTN